MTKAERIKLLIVEEEKTLARLSKEVTADYQSVKAEHRAEAFKEALRIVERVE